MASEREPALSALTFVQTLKLSSQGKWEQRRCTLGGGSAPLADLRQAHIAIRCAASRFPLQSRLSAKGALGLIQCPAKLVGQVQLAADPRQLTEPPVRVA